ncbi:MAG: GLUG motif-containing protein, partial [Candidatus Hydrogenedens sp.]
MNKFVLSRFSTLLFLLITALISSVAYADLIGLNTIDQFMRTQVLYDSILIDTVEKFLKIGKEVYFPLNGNYILNTDLDLSESETWNDGKGYEPVGNNLLPFTGKFDGNGHKIRGVYINRPDESNIGIFGVVGTSGVIENLGVEDYVIVGNEQAGGIAGKNLGKIEKCYSRGILEAVNSVGGLIGLNQGKVTNSFSMSYIKGDTWVGGLIGRNEGGRVENTYAVGKVAGVIRYGGLIGVNNSGTVISSYWDKDRSGLSSSSGGSGKTTTEMGGETTYEDWDFVNIWELAKASNYPYLKVLGPVTFPEPENISISTMEELQQIGKSLDYPWFGNYTIVADIDAGPTKLLNSEKGFEPISEFCGKINGDGHKITGLYINRPDMDNVGLIGRLVSGGKVTSLQFEDCQITGDWKVGSIVGRNEGGTIENCKVIGGQVRGNVYIGGLIGRSDNGSISLCSFAGTIEGYDTIGGLLGQNAGGVIIACSTNAQIVGDFNIGGLVGGQSKGSISESYSLGTINSGGSQMVGGFVGNNAGTITNCYTTTNVTAYAYAGGFSGINSGNISKCYSAGVVKGTSTGTDLQTVGGFNGYNMKGTYTNVYWDMDVSTQKNSDGGYGLMTKEMKCSTFYMNWDFVSVWYMRRGLEYPVLRWQGDYEGELEGEDNCEGEGYIDGEQ